MLAKFITRCHENGLFSELHLTRPLGQVYYSYALDPVGNRTAATEASGRTLSWSYDGVNRLTNESVAQDPAGRNGSVSYTLDPVGNRLATASTLAGMASSSATYSPDDLLSTESYDLNGNVLATGGRSFTYDSENRLVAMNGGAAGSQVAIQYDGWGNRVAETANGTTTRFLVDDLNPTGYPQVVEELVSGAVTRQYTNGLQRINENQHISGKWTPSFYGYDGMGNVRQLSNLAGTITDNYEYDAFGNVILSTGNTPNNYLYRGEQYDATLGLQYLRARYYNPVTGRFLSKDSWSGTINDPASLHKYSYAEANPISGRDPSGLIDVAEANLLDSLPKVYGLRYVSRNVNCIFYTAAGTLEATSKAEQAGDINLLSVNVDYSTCGGHAADEKGNGGPKIDPHSPEGIAKCASKRANQYSAARIFRATESPVATALLGNTFSGISDAYFHFAENRLRESVADIVLGGYGQGIPVGNGIAVKGVAGVATDAFLNRITAPVDESATASAAEGLAGRIGWAKFTIDGAIFAAAITYCETHP